MSLSKKRYQVALQEWKEHCQEKAHSSNPNDYTDCQAFRDLVAMGQPVLPLVLQTMVDDPDPTFCIFGWTELVRRIVGPRFLVSEKIAGKVQLIFEYTKRWLISELQGNSEPLRDFVRWNIDRIQAEPCEHIRKILDLITESSVCLTFESGAGQVNITDGWTAKSASCSQCRIFWKPSKLES